MNNDSNGKLRCCFYFYVEKYKHLKSVYYQCSGENLTFIPVLTTHETETDYI